MGNKLLESATWGTIELVSKRSFGTRFWARFRRDWGYAVRTQLLVGLFLAAATSGGQYYLGIITALSFKTIIVLVFPYGLIAMGFAGYHAIRAVKAIYDEDQTDLEKSQAVHEADQAALKAENQKNAKPEIRGEVFGFKTGIYGGGIQQDGKSYVSAEFTFTLTVCNHRQVETNIREVVLDGTTLGPPVLFSPVNSIRGGALPIGATPPKTLHDFRLTYGIQETIPLTCSATAEGKLKEVDLEKLIVKLVDGFGDSHKINVRPEERLKF